MPFDIRQLRYAVAAADHRSFYRAAHALGVEQSNLSRHVRRLERAISLNLFVRSRAGVAATVAGEVFLRDARRMVAQSEHMLATARAAGQGRAGGLMLGHNNPISAGHLRATLFAWRDAHPDVVLDGVEDGRDVLLAGLDSGMIDLVILPGEAAYPGARRTSFWSERVMIAVPTSHELASREPIHWHDLTHESFMLPARDPGPETRDMLLGRLSGPGFRPDIKLHAISHESLMSVLGGGRSISVTCEGAQGVQYPDVVMKEVRGAHGQTLLSFSAYWRPDNQNPALKRFLAFVRSRYSLSFDIG